MVDLKTTAHDQSFIPNDPAASRPIIYLRYERNPDSVSETPDSAIVSQALRQLENNAVHIAEVVTESLTGRIVPNAWNADCIAGPLGSPLAHAISTRPAIVGLGEDKNGQLLVAASMSGVVGFYAPRASATAGHGRLLFLGHTVNDVRQVWIKSLKSDDALSKLYRADADFEPNPEISSIVPQVHLPKGRFWDVVHFDARTNFALAMREFEKVGIEVVPNEAVITDECRKAALLVPQHPFDDAAFQELRDIYQSPAPDGIVLLPSCAMPAPAIADWPLSPGRYDPEPFEMIMPVVLTDSVAITVPNGYSAEGLPMGLTLAAPAHLTARLLALAEWFCGATPWPTLAEA